MTDEEVICTWMDPTRKSRIWWQAYWWPESKLQFIPRALTFNLLWLVQDSLSPDQRKLYMNELTGLFGDDCAWRLVHMTVEQKKSVLATLIRYIRNPEKRRI